MTNVCFVLFISDNKLNLVGMALIICPIVNFLSPRVLIMVNTVQTYLKFKTLKHQHVYKVSDFVNEKIVYRKKESYETDLWLGVQNII